MHADASLAERSTTGATERGQPDDVAEVLAEHPCESFFDLRHGRPAAAISDTPIAYRQLARTYVRNARDERGDPDTEVVIGGRAAQPVLVGADGLWSGRARGDQEESRDAGGA